MVEVACALAALPVASWKESLAVTSWEGPPPAQESPMVVPVHCEAGLLSHCHDLVQVAYDLEEAVREGPGSVLRLA